MQLTVAAALVLAMPAWAGMYSKSSPVLQVDAKSFDKNIRKTNYTSIVEFYAPWCGHCQNLKPAYEKAARNLDGMANVAAVDCDEDANKQLCGSLGIQGFPTLKIFRPTAKFGKPKVDDYRGGRTASAITQAVAAEINNNVKKVTDKDADAFVGASGPKALLFTEKGTTSALIRSVAIDYLSVVSVGQVRNKEAKMVEKYGIDKFPSLVLIPEGSEEAVKYDGEFNKKDIVEFLKKSGLQPNPTAGGKAKPADKKEKEKKKPADKKKEKKAPKEEKVEEPEPEPEAAEPEAVEPAAPKTVAIQTITDFAALKEQCLLAKSGTCVLALVPSETSDDGAKAVDSLNQLNTKYAQGHRQVFPFIAVPNSIEEFATVKAELELNNDKVELIAINARRKWWRQYEGDLSAHSVEAWVDAIRMGEGSKKKLPKSVITKEEEKVEEPKAEEAKEEDHDEL